eukprot:403334269
MKLLDIQDYQSDFVESFRNYQDEKVQKDELYYGIRDKLEQKELKREERERLRGKDMIENPILPITYQNEAQKVERQIIERRVKLEIEREQQQINNDLTKNMKLNLIPQLDNKNLQNMLPESNRVTYGQQTSNMQKGFDMSFEQIDLELKAQLHALIEADHDTFRKLQCGEMSNDETKIYLKTINLKDVSFNVDEKEEKDSLNKYDSDLNSTTYQEFWSDMKKAKSTRNSKSVTRRMSQDRGSGYHQRNQQSTLLPNIYNNQQSQNNNNYSTIEHKKPVKIQAFITEQPNQSHIDENDKVQQEQDQKYEVIQEYDKKFHKYDHVRNELKNKDTEKSLQIHIKKLEAKVKNLERSHIIELRYAKEKAKEKADKLIRDRLEKAKQAYQFEFSNLASQYHNIKTQLDETEKQVRELSSLAGDQENIITHLNNYIETVGYQLRKKDHFIKSNSAQIELADSQLSDYQNLDNVPQSVLKAVQEGRELLQQPYAFYTFGITLAMDDQIEILYRQVVRFYQMKIVTMRDERFLQDIELGQLREIAANFKRSEERAQQQILELQMKIQLLNEEKINQQQNFDRRFNQAAKDFVTEQRQTKQQFENYKQVTRIEVRAHEEIRTKLLNKISGYEKEIFNLKEAIKIPRQYFKIRDDMKYDHFLEQRDQILDKLKQEIDTFDPKQNKTRKKFVNIAEILSIQNDDSYIQQFIEDTISRKRKSLQTSNNPLLNRDFSMFSMQTKTTAADVQSQNIPQQNQLNKKNDQDANIQGLISQFGLQSGRNSKANFESSKFKLSHIRNVSGDMFQKRNMSYVAGSPDSSTRFQSQHSLIMSPSFHFGMQSKSVMDQKIHYAKSNNVSKVMKYDESSKFLNIDTPQSQSRAISRNDSNFQN